MSTRNLDLISLFGLCLSENRRANWELLIDLIQPDVERAVRRSLARSGQSTADSARDLVQDVFLKLCAGDFSLLRACRAETQAQFRAYLVTIAASTVIDHFRVFGSQKNGSGTPPASLDDFEPYLTSAEDPAKMVERRILLTRIEHCLEPHKEKSRTIFWLYHRDGYKPKHIAALPGIALASDAVETLLYRLTLTVRECLQRSGVIKIINTRNRAGV